MGALALRARHTHAMTENAACSFKQWEKSCPIPFNDNINWLANAIFRKRMTRSSVKTDLGGAITLWIVIGRDRSLRGFWVFWDIDGTGVYVNRKASFVDYVER